MQSALKAHRQSVKNREHNRQFRSAPAQRAQERAHGHRRQRSRRRPKPRSKRPCRLIDRMASKGVIHRNAAGALQVAPADPPRSARVSLRHHRREALARASLPRAQLDDEPFEKDAGIAGRSLQVMIGSKHRLDRASDVGRARSRNFDRTSHASCPRIFPGPHRRRTSGRAAAAPRRPDRFRCALVIAQSSCSAAGPATSFTSSSVMRFWPSV